MMDELKKRQRAFIPINIITCVLALVAGLSLLFTPFLTIDMGVMMNAIAQGIESEGGSDVSGSGSDVSGSGSDVSESGNDPSYNEMNEQEVIMKMISSSIDFKLTFTPLGFMGLGADENPMKTFMRSMFEGDFIENAFSAGVGAGLVVLVGISDSEDITASDLERLNVTELSAFLKTAETDEEAAYREFLDSVRSVTDEFGIELEPDYETSMREEFDAVIAKGKKTDDSAFSLEYLVCQAVSSAGEDSENPPPQIESYDELADYFADNFMPADELPDPSMLSTGFYAIAMLVIFPAIMWLLLALLSGIHILLKNKTFLTWYVKLTGFFPCLLFGIAPLIVKAVMGGTAATVIGAIGTMTWISGGCFIALAILSIGFLYPRRRKIRRLRRESK